MENDDEKVSRDELLGRFRDALKRPMSERYFDEDDLIEIFDYAGDLNDDYLRMEAMLVAARYYPDSEEMNQRRGIFYSQYSDDTRSKYLNDNTESKGFIWDALRLRAYPPSEREKGLNYLLDTYNFLSGEDTIQLVQLASSMNMADWVRDNMPRLREKVEYVEMLLYEMAVISETHNRPDLGIPALEELTEMVPFNGYYWSMLAHAAINAGDYEKALMALDYALAIDPNDPQALFEKAKIENEYRNDSRTAIELLQRSLQNKPDNSEPGMYLAHLMADAGDDKGAIALYKRMLEMFPIDAEVILPELVVLDPDNSDELMDRFFNVADGTQDIMWVTWAKQLADRNYLEQAKRVLDCFKRNTGRKVCTLIPAEILYKQGNYAGALSEVEDFKASTGCKEENLPMLGVLSAICLAKVGRYTEAMDVCRRVMLYISVIAIDENLQTKLEYQGMYRIFQTMYELLQVDINIEPGSTDAKLRADFWQQYDPFSIA